MDFQQVYTIIRNMILQIVTDDYDHKNIRQSFQAPSGNNFISYEITTQYRQNVKGTTWYSKIEDIISNNVLESLNVQLDYWSDKPYVAQNNATRMHVYLSQIAQDYLNESYPHYGIGVIDNVMNMTESGDKAKYLYRYCIRFELFAQNILVTPMQYTDKVNAKLEFIE